jgi:hypothetical protein
MSTRAGLADFHEFHPARMHHVGRNSFLQSDYLREDDLDSTVSLVSSSPVHETY